jgi:CheY-like chemotaxis protein/anti-sigma regulatory factor (Ser/Thr protein kinase)
LVDNILDYNKIEAGKLQIEQVSFNLLGMVQQLVTFFEGQIRHKKLLFKMELDESANVFVLADITRLRQVLTNLLSNAIKFTSHGFVGIAVKALPQTTANQLLICIEIEDTGIGIEKGKVDLIFQSFTQADIKTTRKFGGSGLGLTISKSLVTLMGGELHVESEIGKGSKFIVKLPCVISEKQPVLQTEKRLTEFDALQNVRILVAEDNKVNMMVVKSILEKWDVDVVLVENGQEAINEMNVSAFDLILMDLEMPVMDGATAVGIIRKTHPHLPIIALTAAFYENMLEDLLQKGMNDYVKKPFRPEELYAKLFTHLHGKVIV